MAKIKLLKPLVPGSDGRTIAREPKRVDTHYLAPEHRAWREQVVRSAGGRCEWIENGTRCGKASPQHRMFADHIIERSDGGSAFDPANGQCLCGAHHTRKTMLARAQRANK